MSSPGGFGSVGSFSSMLLCRAVTPEAFGSCTVQFLQCQLLQCSDSFRARFCKWLTSQASLYGLAHNASSAWLPQCTVAGGLPQKPLGTLVAEHLWQDTSL